jgi:glyoxylase-like metal-dependent hydrolase (beta-lactamase superfamily II)
MNPILSIELVMPFKLGAVRCYLVEQDSSFLLVDTGSSNQRQELERQLESAGCRPGSLKLIALTHGDFDHTGNAAYLRRMYGGLIAMHPDDAGMAEKGDMFFNRKPPNVIIRKLLPILSGFGKAQRFSPDILLQDEMDLTQVGFPLKVLSLPGHSRGSIGLLTAEGDLFCGDLFTNLKGPQLSAIMDDPTAGSASVARLKRLNIHTVYPGHGEPFRLAEFLQDNP